MPQTALTLKSKSAVGLFWLVLVMERTKPAFHPEMVRLAFERPHIHEPPEQATMAVTALPYCAGCGSLSASGSPSPVALNE
jgi:hypothetical protein